MPQTVSRSDVLARCINITGSGLEVLIGSTVLQKIDLSLVKRYEEPKITPKPRLDQVTIFVILDSIIDASDNSLRHVQLPEHILRTMSNPFSHSFLFSGSKMHS